MLTRPARDRRSRHDGHVRIETPQLVVPYHPEGEAVRPTNDRPCGASIEAAPELLADHPTPGEHPDNLITLRKLRQGKM